MLKYYLKGRRKMKEKQIYEKVKLLVEDYFSEDIKKDFDEAKKLLKKEKRISKYFRKDRRKEENELYLEYDRKIKEKIKEINVKYKSCINTYINDLEIRNVFKKEYEFKDDIKPYVEFLETLYVLKVLVKVNSFCLQEKTIKIG